MTSTAPISPDIARAFAPAGVLRASINLGNPILANRDKASGEPVGVSIDLAQALAGRLGLPIELVVFDKAAQSVDAVKNGAADIGFFAIDPARGEGLRFSAPYVLIEGSYLVPQGSALEHNDEVDRAGTRVAVGSGSAYDLFLTRELKQATIERVASAPAVLAALLAGQVEVAAGIRKLLEDWAQQHAALRLLPGRFMVIQQAMGLPADRGADAAAVLADFVEAMKASGFVADSLRRHGIVGGTVAPPSA
ncbi:transporter substrate-binding domain-containing protein [Variovorax sp. J22G21]|uniref:transporter substrate-binding domain-containing protein n=1 Tax=Variovorax fucosicus TaxID=3053517 RepID=UPI002575367C|nr:MULTISPECIES: transporter substrate-binding domain-containing protein [unclassified Variovorax]MDM0041563.1 transporter substrate-binding domain-containing protein [Variovorax sp. J22R193]MDM0060619.1 transporter substrate-binding domain-containing protein [Variovorax sp. J22G21]